MSRNLCKTNCDVCGHDVMLLEPERAITESDTGPHYFAEFRGLLVANAECPMCLAKYLAWVRWPNSGSSWGNRHDGTHFDLSYREAFDDEPSAADLPEHEVKREVVYTRVGPYAKPEWAK